MPLDRYQRKRDFTKTPEPAGAPAIAPKAVAPERAGRLAASAAPVPGPRGRFVVQRHRATRLHYDFRLEIGGVLVSWAVPRGPTLDPEQRRMAVHVEDHPIEYLDFEGVIPPRQYGAGDVIVWDWGTWEPETETPDPALAVEDGELKFRLHGQKLGGRFTIVQTSGRPTKAERQRSRQSAATGRAAPERAPSRASEGDGGEQWLLIKKRDEAARDGWDAEDHPQSVKTGRTNDDVKANADALWISEAPAAVAEVDLSAAEPARPGEPRFVEPMLATLSDRPFDDEDWLFEVKWDGYRVQAVVWDGKARIYTRNGHDAATYFPGLLQAPRTWIRAEAAILDGEVVALDDEGRPDFGLLQARISQATGGRVPGQRGSGGRRGHSHEGGDGVTADADDAAARAPLVYQVFDLLQLDGRSLLRVPLEDRKRLLRSILTEGSRVRFAAHVDRDGTTFYRAAAERGLEGVVAKHRRSRYEPGRRSTTWLKLKLRPEQALVVGGWTSGEGNAKELGALIVGVREAEGGPLRFAGKVGSGFDARARRRLRERLDGLASDACPFEPPPGTRPDLRGARWVEPSLVIRAELGGWSRDGLVRQSAFKGIDDGRDPASVIRELPVASGPAHEAAEAAIGPARSRSRPGAGTGPRGAGTGPRGVASAHQRGGVVPTALPPEWAAATEEELDALERLGRQGAWRVGGIELKLTNLDKVIFPGRPAGGPGTPAEEPVTKRDLIGYFARIAPAMLPHLAERPLNLQRFPDGAEHPGFWQKDLRTTDPAWLRRWREPGAGTSWRAEGARARDANTHLVADRTATLCWLGNQAAFEIHAWTSRLTAPDRPTFALIDIDPGERTTWDETLVLARLFRTALEHLGVRGCPKTTGKRGIQVWIPIEPRYGYDETSAWVEGVSRAVGAIVPDLVSWEWSKDRRDGRARLDYTQNTYIKTLVAPYAVRPAPGAPVSAPIAWDELDDPSLRPDRWTIRTLPARVAALGDLFAGAQGDLQVLPPLG
jgi:bifunctional non-homologous end joining protein LigD